MDPWIAVSGLAGIIVSALMLWVREMMVQRREHAARSEERARLEGELVVTLATHGKKLDKIDRRLDNLPCSDCGPAQERRPVAL